MTRPERRWLRTTLGAVAAACVLAATVILVLWIWGFVTSDDVIISRGLATVGAIFFASAAWLAILKAVSDAAGDR